MVGTPRWRRPELTQAQQARGAARALRLAYREHGMALLDHLAGAFAFAILDRPNRRALLAIDRMGVHSLYYSSASAERLVFGTTADMVRAHPGVGASVPLQSVYGYLHAFVCRSPGTLYAEQRKPGPAQYLLWQDGESRVESYGRTAFEANRQQTPETRGAELGAPGGRADR